MATGDLTIKYGVNGKLIEASGSSFFANSQNDKKINFIFNEDLGDSVVFASFKLPIAVQTNLYGNYKAQSLLLSKKVDDDGGYYYTAYLPAEYIEISTLLNNKMYVNAVVQTTNGVEQFKGVDGAITINNVACTWVYGTDDNIVITYKGTEYTESNNAITIENKVYLIKDKTASGTVTLEAGLIVKTYQPVEIKVLDSQGTYNAIPVMQGQYDVLSKRIAEIDSKIADKQDKVDSKITFNNGVVVDALNGLDFRVTNNLNEIKSQNTRITANAKDIEWLKGKVQGIVSVGVLETNETTATNDELDAFVLEKMGREPQVNDAVVNNVIKENDTDESYFFIYNESSDWQGFQIQFIETASNTAKGILKGSGDEATSDSPIKVSIANGEIVDVQVFGESSKSLSTWIQILNDIYTGAVAVPKATADENGNDIVDTYLTKNDGATKQYVQDYSAPKCLYDVFYCNFANQSLVENNTSDDSYNSIVSSSEIGETQVATLDLALLHDVQIGKQNGIALQLNLSKNIGENVDIIVRTYYKTTTATDWVLLGSAKSSNVTLNSSINTFKINNYFTELAEPITLNTGDIIEQRVFVNRSSSRDTKFTLVCNTTYPSLAEITKQGIIKYYLEKTPAQLELGNSINNSEYKEGLIIFSGNGRIVYDGANSEIITTKVSVKADYEATENSNALLTSGTIYNALKETGKINSISLNNEALDIDENKNVNIDITAYATKQYVDENGGKVEDVQVGGESILDTTTKIANIESQEPEQMTIDETAIKDSTNLITSGAVYNAMGLEMELIYSTENGVNLATLIDTAEAVIGNFKALAISCSTSVNNSINSPLTFLEIPATKTSDISSYGYTGTKNVQLRCSNPTSSGMTEWVFDVNYGELSTTNTLNMYFALKGQLTYTESGVSYSASTSGQSGIERLYIYGIR